MEKICKANCECPEEEGYYYYGPRWNDEKNCKKACAGYAQVYEASLADRETEPCDDIREIIRDMRACARESCGDNRDECVSREFQRFYECWPYDAYYDYEYFGESNFPNLERPIHVELREKLLYQGNFSSDL
jgi:hypothetical protein